MGDAGGFMRSSGGGPGWRYETSEAYGLEYVAEDQRPVQGWHAITQDGRPVAYVQDGPMATALRELLNRSEQLHRRVQAERPGGPVELLAGFLETAERDGAGFRMDVTAEAMEKARQLVRHGGVLPEERKP